MGITHDWKIGGCLIVLLSSAGCNGASRLDSAGVTAGEGAAQMRVSVPAEQTKTTTEPNVVQQINPNTRVVTGEPVPTAPIPSDPATQVDAESGKTAEDQNGAVAIKMQY